MRARAHGDPGFTLVELLLVMLILGLLASIAVPTFFGERDKARDADAKAAVRAAATAAETIATNNGGAYDTADGVTLANLREVEKTLNDADLTVLSATHDGFALRVTSTTENTFDYLRNGDGTAELVCAPAGAAGCPPDGTWDD